MAKPKAGKIWSRIADRFMCWKARADYVRELEAQPAEGAAQKARKHYLLAAAIRKRDRLRPPKPWLTWRALEEELRFRGQM